MTYHGVVFHFIHEPRCLLTFVDVEPQRSLELITSVQQERVLRVLVPDLVDLGHSPGDPSVTPPFLPVAVFAAAGVLVHLLDMGVDIIGVDEDEVVGQSGREEGQQQDPPHGAGTRSHRFSPGRGIHLSDLVTFYCGTCR